MVFLTALLLAAAPPEVALLCTEPQGPVTELRFQPVGAHAPVAAAARLEHLAGESVQGSVLPGRHAVVAVAVAEAPKDLSFASHLYLLEANKPSRDLADRVQLGARPFVTATGRVFVARGRAGTSDFDPRQSLRVDAITLDEVDLRTGKARTVLAFDGYAVFPVGEWRGALVVYRVTPRGGEFLTVHPDALGVTRVALVPPQARDFSIDATAGAIVFTQAADETTWEVRSLDLATGLERTLARGPSMALLPTVFPDGRVAVSNGPGEGLAAAGRFERLLPSQGAGFDHVRAFTLDGRLAVGLNELPDGFDVPFAVAVGTGMSLPLAAPKGVRLDVAGWVRP